MDLTFWVGIISQIVSLATLETEKVHPCDVLINPYGLTEESSASL